MKIITSRIAAQMLEMQHGTLKRLLSRQPELKPAMRINGDDFVWTESEVERVHRYRTRPRRRRGQNT